MFRIFLYNVHKSNQTNVPTALLSTAVVVALIYGLCCVMWRLSGGKCPPIFSHNVIALVNFNRPFLHTQRKAIKYHQCKLCDFIHNIVYTYIHECDVM